MASPLVGADYAPLVARACRTLGEGRYDDPELLASLVRFIERIAAWNQQIDLTAARSPAEHVDLVVADALAVLSAASPGADEHWVDVGSGAGAPGVTLALLAPRLRMTLVEPRHKRVAFLRSVLAELGRLDVEVIPSESARLAAASFDVAISRATFPPPVWLAEGRRLARQRVWLLLARATAPEGSGPVRECSYAWPLTGALRRALCYPVSEGG